MLQRQIHSILWATFKRVHGVQMSNLNPYHMQSFYRAPPPLLPPPNPAYSFPLHPHLPPSTSSTSFPSILPQSIAPSSSTLHFLYFLPFRTATVHSPPHRAFCLPLLPFYIPPPRVLYPTLSYIGIKIITSFPSNSTIHHLLDVCTSYSFFHFTIHVPISYGDGSQLALLYMTTVSTICLIPHLKRLAHPRHCQHQCLAANLIAVNYIVQPRIKRVIIRHHSPYIAWILADKRSPQTRWLS